MHELVVRDGEILTQEGRTRCDIGIDEGRIAGIAPHLKGRREIDAARRVVLPGAIDAHTHMALPVRGIRTSDDFLSGTTAAAWGGVTMIVDFSVAAEGVRLAETIERRLDEASDAIIDFSLHAEVVGWYADRTPEFAEAVALGVRTFKFYTTYSDSGRMTDGGALRQAFPEIARLGGRAMIHAENDEIVRTLTAEALARGDRGIRALPRCRPPAAEATAIDRVARLARNAGVSLRIAHVSSKDGLAAVHDARAAGTSILAETCPQYLLLDDTAYEGPEGHLLAASPPLRKPADNAALWSGCRDGGIDLVATDHCPFTRDQKAWSGSFVDLPYGLPGVETLLPLLLGEGVAENRLSLEQAVRLVSEGPARALGVFPRKGALAVGSDADLVVVDPAHRRRLRADDLHMNVDFSPFLDRWVILPTMTLSRGRVLVDGGRFAGTPGWGRFVPQTA